MRISDWSSDVCSSDLLERGDAHLRHFRIGHQPQLMAASRRNRASRQNGEDENQRDRAFHRRHSLAISFDDSQKGGLPGLTCPRRSEEHTSELQSLMRISYAVFCLKKKKQKQTNRTQILKQTTA